MIALALRVAQVLLSVAFAVLLWGVVSPLRARSIPDVEYALPQRPQRDVAAFTRYAVIRSRNLFQTPEDTAALSAPIEEVIPESQVRYTVVGTVAGAGKLAVALLENARGERKAFSVGDTLQGTAVTVERIERRRVVLNNGGRREAIDMKELQAPTSLALLQSGKEIVNDVRYLPPPPPAFAAVASPELVARVSSRQPPSRRPPRPAPPAPSPSVAQVELPSENSRLGRTLIAGSGATPSAFTAIAGPVRMAPGSAFEAVAGQSMLEALRGAVALGEGEEIFAVNGIPVEAADRLPELLRSLMRRGPARVQIAVDSTLEREIEVTLP